MIGAPPEQVSQCWWFGDPAAAVGEVRLLLGWRVLLTTVGATILTGGMARRRCALSGSTGLELFLNLSLALLPAALLE
eukprot:14539557-Alexandrium_andersonii.AAC.1